MIRVLPQDVINKIAAGEVVERPASVVKELVENAIDAGARQINIEIGDGGKNLIQVSDNGSGIQKNDIALVFQPHATSKLSTLDDLDLLHTLGFRGEAMATIASIAEVTLRTNFKNEATGWELQVLGGKVSEIREIAKANSGTVVSIKNLFFNTPARQKFLKSSSTELGHIIGVVEKQALANPTIGINLVSASQKTIFDLKPTNDLKKRIVDLLGKDIEKSLLEVTYQKDSVVISGYISQPQLTRSNLNDTYLFVNNRPVQPGTLGRAVLNGYDTMLESRRFPVYVLAVHVPSNEVDVNVHPQKTEVKFAQERLVFKSVQTAVRSALERRMFSADSSTTLQEVKKDSPFSSQTLYGNSTKPMTSQSGLIREPSPPHYSQNSEFRPQDSKLNLSNIVNKSLDYTPEIYPEVLQINNRYIVFEQNKAVTIIDQHAAHEKILFEQLSSQDISKPIISQLMLIPLAYEFSKTQKQFILDHKDLLQGFELEDFGGNTIIVNSVPSFLKKDQVKNLTYNVLQELALMQEVSDTQKLKRDFLKMAACKMAVKAGDSLSKQEIHTLLNDLSLTSFGFTCCHGRPTTVELDEITLQKMFSRR